MPLHRARIGLLSASLVVSLALAGASSAGAKPHFKISPKAPIVDDSTVTVSWRTDRALKPGYHYQAMLSAGSGPDTCFNLITKNSQRRPGKGKPMSFDFHIWDDKYEGGDEWCQGKATVIVSMVRDDPKDLVSLGIFGFRFRAKP
jgi:hypothetical protein